jgi:peptidoglycan/LPS O-acetylase OafA/YrhL
MLPLLRSRFARNALQDLTTAPAGNIPALDVLRCTALLMVLAYHTSGVFTKLSGQDDRFATLPLVLGGWRGVDLFFVLSGYLIGRQLWRELRETGTIRLGRFVVLRRGLRIWPLYYFCIPLWLVGSQAGRAGFSSFRWWPDAAFLSNYLPGGVLPQAWSLCIEEQFYLLAPLFILAIAGATRRRDPSLFRPWLIAFLLAQPVIRAVILRFEGDRFSTPHQAFASLFFEPFHTHADGLLIGLLVANLADKHRPDRPGRALGYLVGAACLAAVGRKASQVVFDFSGSALVFGALTWLVLSLPRSSSAFLGSRAFFVISRLSYGMYLNHQLIMEWITPAAYGLVRSLHLPLPVANAAFAGIVAALSAAVAIATYCLIEWPFLRLRDRMLDHRMRLLSQARDRGELAASLSR